MANEASSWRHGLQMAKLRQLKTMENVQKNCNLRTLSREYDCLAKIGTKEAFTLLLGN